MVTNELFAIIAPAGIAATVAIGCSFADRLGAALQVLDYPDGIRKVHSAPTPLVGGVALMIPVMIYAIVEAVLSGHANPVFIALAFAGAGATFLGYLDDRYGLSAMVRLMASATLCGIAAVLIEPRMLLHSFDFGSGWVVPFGIFALPMTLLCAVGLQNAVNMADGKNGLVISLALFWAVCMLFHAPPELYEFLLLLIIGLAILLIFNLAGKIFLGDAGAYSIGMVFGLLAIYIHNAADGRLPMLTVALWFFVPVLDCLRLIAERLLNGRSPMAPDCRHLHHLLAGRWPWPRGLVVYLALAAVPGLLASIWPTMTMGLIALTFAGYGWLLHRGGRTVQPASLRPQPSR